MNVAQLIAEFGNYYLNSPANMQRIIKMLQQQTVTQNYFTTVLTDDTVWRATRSQFSKVVQAFQKQWTPKGALTFTPAEIFLDHLKIDVEMYPDDIEGTWLGFLADNNQKRSEWPVVRYAVEQLINQIRTDVELDEVYNGVHAAPVNGVPSATGTNMHGIKKQLVDGIAAGDINEIAIGPLSAGTIFDQVEEFVDGIGGLYANQPMAVFMNESWARAYHRDKRNTLGAQPTYDPNAPNIDFTTKTVVGLPSMVGSNRFWTTPKANAIRLLKKTNQSSIHVEESKRQVFLMTDWYEGVGFAFPQLVWASDNA